MYFVCLHTYLAHKVNVTKRELVVGRCEHSFVLIDSYGGNNRARQRNKTHLAIICTNSSSNCTSVRTDSRRLAYWGGPLVRSSPPSLLDVTDWESRSPSGSSRVRKGRSREPISKLVEIRTRCWTMPGNLHRCLNALKTNRLIERIEP